MGKDKKLESSGDSPVKGSGGLAFVSDGPYQ